MRNAPHLLTTSSLGQVPHSVGRPWIDTNRNDGDEENVTIPHSNCQSGMH